MPDEIPEAEQKDRPQSRSRSPIAWAVFIAAFLVLVLIAPGIHPFQRAEPPSQPPSALPGPRPQEATDPAQVAQCDQVIQQGQHLGLIRDRPQKQRIGVDERLWALMDASERRGLLLALRCSAYSSAARTADEAVAYGAHSGKRLGVAGANGVTLD
jgi:hypothetical protein